MTFVFNIVSVTQTKYISKWLKLSDSCLISSPKEHGDCSDMSMRPTGHGRYHYPLRLVVVALHILLLLFSALFQFYLIEIGVQLY